MAMSSFASGWRLSLVLLGLSSTVAVVAAVAGGCGGDDSSGSGGTGTNSCAGVTCSACDPLDFTHPIQVHVRDAVTSEGITDAAVTSDAVDCIADTYQGLGWYRCEAEVGTHTIDVEATGYEPATLEVTVTAATGCCSCGDHADPVVVDLDAST